MKFIVKKDDLNDTVDVFVHPETLTFLKWSAYWTGCIAATVACLVVIKKIDANVEPADE